MATCWSSAIFFANFSRKHLEVSEILFTFAPEKLQAYTIGCRWLRVSHVCTPKGGHHTKPRVLHSGLSVCDSATNPLVVQPAPKTYGHGICNFTQKRRSYRLLQIHKKKWQDLLSKESQMLPFLCKVIVQVLPPFSRDVCRLPAFLYASARRGRLPPAARHTPSMATNCACQGDSPQADACQGTVPICSRTVIESARYLSPGRSLNLHIAIVNILFLLFLLSKNLPGTCPLAEKNRANHRGWLYSSTKTLFNPIRKILVDLTNKSFSLPIMNII